MALRRWRFTTFASTLKRKREAPMKLDLSEAAGLPLSFDTATNQLTSQDGLVFNREARCVDELSDVLYESREIDLAQELYWIFPMQDAGASNELFEAADLTYSFVLLPPGTVGGEFVKTRGHYHPEMPGSDLAYPEVYSHLLGRPYLLMQHRFQNRANQVDDCVLIELSNGMSVMIPPGYAHILINPTNEPAVISGLYSRSFRGSYDPITEMAGAAYFVLDEDGEKVVPNHRYADCPPLERLTNLAGTPFEPPNGIRPLWSSFLEDPDRYAFLTDPEAARQVFAVRNTNSCD
jgi:glucose-6-phosphate isomerase, archaeal